MASRTPNRTILIVNDRHEILAYFFNLFESGELGSFDILGDAGKPSHRWHPTIRHIDPLKFDEMFEAMVRSGNTYPLCIIDMQMPGADGKLDDQRGLVSARRARELDPRIHIMICTHLPFFDGAELVASVGGSTHFFRMPFSGEQEQEFCRRVRDLIDDWNRAA